MGISGASNGTRIAGGMEKGSRNNQLNYPSDVVIDKDEQKLIICDRGNQRVVRWGLDVMDEGEKQLFSMSNVSGQWSRSTEYSLLYLY